MTFLAGQRLGLLPLVALLAVAYLLVQRRRSALRVRFTDLDLLASVAPRRPGWRRHVIPVLLLLTAGTLIVGFARPTLLTRAVDRQRGTVLVALDVSESMVATDVAATRIEAAKQAAAEFITGLGPGVQVGLVTFDRNAAEQGAPTQDRNAVQTGLRQAQLGPGTAIGEAVFLCLQAAQATQPGAPSTDRVVLLSDGANNAGRTPEQAAAAARAAHVPVSTIAYGTPAGTVTIGGQTIAVPADYTALRALAQDSGGHPYTAQNLVQLRHGFADLTPTVTASTRHTEITAWLAGFALALVLLAVAAQLAWTPALP